MAKKKKKKKRVGLSRQRLWQKKKQAEGLCPLCGKERDPQNATYCTEHTLIQRRLSRENNRKYTGCQPWVPGGRGRPPKEAS